MSNVNPWEPYREMMTLREAMNRLFEESFVRPTADQQQEQPGLPVPLDIYETDTGLVLRAALPGVRPEDMEVTVTGDVLTIKGRCQEQTTEEKRRYLRQECHFGDFNRQLSLPSGLDTSKISADFENGMLTLELPKVAEVKPKSIRITAKKS